LRDLARIGRDVVSITQEDSLLDPETLASMSVPVLLVWGEEDRLADVSGAPVLLDAVVASRLVALEDCGHCPQVEAPEVVAELLLGLPSSVAGHEAVEVSTTGSPSEE
jgi:pimeloyl-ACP methyl ester carboxylesterase